MEKKKSDKIASKFFGACTSAVEIVADEMGWENIPSVPEQEKEEDIESYIGRLDIFLDYICEIIAEETGDWIKDRLLSD